MCNDPFKEFYFRIQENREFYYDRNSYSKTIYIEKKIFEISQIIISPSTYTTNFIAKHYEINKKQLITIPFGVEIQKNTIKNNLKNLNIKTINLGFVGVVNMRKGIRWFIKVLNELKKKKVIFYLNFTYLEEFLKMKLKL